MLKLYIGMVSIILLVVFIVLIMLLEIFVNVCCDLFCLDVLVIYVCIFLFVKWGSVREVIFMWLMCIELLFLIFERYLFVSFEELFWLLFRLENIVSIFFMLNFNICCFDNIWLYYGNWVGWKY